MIPPSYKPARWRCALPVEKESGDLAIGFDVGAGFDAAAEVVRLRISTECAWALIESLRAVIDGQQRTACFPAAEEVPVPRLIQ